MEKNKLKELATAYLRGKASEEEENELHKWYDETINHDEERVITNADETQEQIRNRILAALRQRMGTASVTPSRPIALTRFNWMRVAAALLILLIGPGTYYFLRQAPQTGRTIAAINAKKVNDVLPGKNTALLTLANGDKIVLDSATTGKLVQQGNTSVINQNGLLVYDAAGPAGEQLMYNTLSTARGEVYPLVLSDGTKVWLNAASSIRFPVAFTGSERNVEITGEAYFEVAKNLTRPFKVRVKGNEIRVLGTHFNVMAYDDEASVKTTLLEGAVQFVNASHNVLLRPLEQLQIISNGQAKVVNNVDVAKVVAWKNGFFNFEGANFETVAKQLSRWYDVEVNYDRKMDELFYAEIPRNTKLSVVLKALELTGKVRFKIEGKKIIVIP